MTTRKFSLGARFRKGWTDFLGTSIFNSDMHQPIWKRHRSAARPFFGKDRISDFDTFEKMSSRLVEAIKRLQSSSLSNDGAVDMQNLLQRFTLDAGCEFLFGYDTVGN